MRTHVARLGYTALSAAAAFLAMSPVLLPADTAMAASPPAAVIRIANFTFSPPMLAVKAGSTVTWVNDDDIPHTVVAQDKSFKSTVLDTGDRFSVTFSKPGQFAYFCSLHPRMTGKVIVKA